MRWPDRLFHSYETPSLVSLFIHQKRDELWISRYFWVCATRVLVRPLVCQEAKHERLKQTGNGKQKVAERPDTQSEGNQSASRGRRKTGLLPENERHVRV
jgi:hypothetical protein